MARKLSREGERGNRAGLVAEEPARNILAHAAGGEPGTIRARQADTLTMLVIVAPCPAGAIGGRGRKADQEESEGEPDNLAAAHRGASAK